MKKLSETLTELGIAFSFPIEITDDNGNETYYEISYGYWRKWEYDANGKVTYHEGSKDYWAKWERDSNGTETYYENSDGVKRGTPKSSKTCEGKVVEVDGLGGIRSSMCLDSNSTLELMQKSTQSTMKKLSEIYKELGIAFSFPIKINDANGNETYYESSYGYWHRYEYDADGNMTYYENSSDFWYRCERDANGKVTYCEDSTGVGWGTPKSAKTCEGKVVEVDGIKYKLKAL